MITGEQKTEGQKKRMAEKPFSKPTPNQRSLTEGK